MRSSFVVLALLVSACAPSPIAVALADDDATHIVATLGKSGVVATKSADPSNDGRFVVSVSAADANAALLLMNEEDLPPRAAPSLDAMAGSSLVPSPRVEQARLLASQAAELERSLRSIDGVVSARVHLAAPAPSLLGLSLDMASERGERGERGEHAQHGEHADGEHTRRDADGERAGQRDRPAWVTASVLVKHRGEQSPIATGEIQKLIAGAISGLRPDAVTVVTVRAAMATPVAEWAQIGPVTVARKSAAAARGLFGALLLACFVLAGLLVWTRLKTARSPQIEGS